MGVRTLRLEAARLGSGPEILRVQSLRERGEVRGVDGLKGRRDLGQ